MSLFSEIPTDIFLISRLQSGQGNEYELRKLKNVEENKRKFKELGLGKYAANPIIGIVQPSTKEKNDGEDGEEASEYNVENESGDESDESSEVIFIYKKIVYLLENVSTIMCAIGG